MSSSVIPRRWTGGTGGPPSWSAEKKREHPASRPGDGRPVVWRNEVHLISPSLRCFVCGLYEDRATAGRCYCGTKNWIQTGLPPAPRPQPAPRLPQADPLGDDDDRGFMGGKDTPASVIVDYEGARLNEVLGGIRKGALVMVVGAAGAGKSTCTAELAAFAARYWSSPDRGDERQPDCKIHWLDSDQKDAGLVRQCFQTAKVEGAFVHRIQLLRDSRRRYSFDDALRLLPWDARVLVCDSLERWGANDTERLAVLDKLRAHPAWLKIVISGTNKLGGVSGSGALERADDATVFAERTADARYTLRFTKRRWQPCESALARGAGREEAVQEAAARAEPSPPAPRVVVSDAPRAEADPIEAEPDDGPPSGEVTSLLPERMDTPYALLLRSWPWSQGVRVTTILAAWRSDESSIQGFCRALRELTGTTDGAIPSAVKIGNALRWARGHALDGMALTCERDRMKVAIWRVVRES